MDETGIQRSDLARCPPPQPQRGEGGLVFDQQLTLFSIDGNASPKYSNQVPAISSVKNHATSQPFSSRARQTSLALQNCTTGQLGWSTTSRPVRSAKNGRCPTSLPVATPASARPPRVRIRCSVLCCTCVVGAYFESVVVENKRHVGTYRPTDTHS